MPKERIKFFRSYEPHGLEQDINNFLENETKVVLEISFLHTVTGHGNEIFYDAYLRYTPKSHQSLKNLTINELMHDDTLYLVSKFPDGLAFQIL